MFWTAGDNLDPVNLQRLGCGIWQGQRNNPLGIWTCKSSETMPAYQDYANATRQRGFRIPPMA
jgi:hypothetical protein